MEIELRPAPAEHVVEAVRRALRMAGVKASPREPFGAWREAALLEAVERDPGASGASQALSPRSTRGATRA